MLYKNYILIFILLVLTNCTTDSLIKNKPNIIPVNNYKNKGFALVYNDQLYVNKIISKKLDERDLVIFQKNLKKNTKVKITNILNGKSLIVTVGNKSNYPTFNNSVISKRISDELILDVAEPYVEIIEINKDSLFVAKKAKTFDEEKKVAIKVPVNNISINDLNKVKNDKKKVTDKNFSYTIKVGDFYFNDTALLMVQRIKNETNIKKPKIKKITDKQHRVFLGPFSEINSLQKSFNDINILGFENIEIIKND